MKQRQCIGYENLEIDQETIDSCHVNYKNYHSYVDEDFEAEMKRHREAMYKILSVPFTQRLKAPLDSSYDKKMDAKELKFWTSKGIDINDSFPLAHWNDSDNWYTRYNDNVNTTPLFYAISESNYILMNLLLIHGADPNMKDVENRTALDWIYDGFSCKYVVISFLLRYGFVLPGNEYNRLGDIILKHNKKLSNLNCAYLLQIYEAVQIDIFKKAFIKFCSCATDNNLKELGDYNGVFTDEFMNTVAKFEDPIVRIFVEKLQKILKEKFHIFLQKDEIDNKLDLSFSNDYGGGYLHLSEDEARKIVSRTSFKLTYEEYKDPWSVDITFRDNELILAFYLRNVCTKTFILPLDIIIKTLKTIL